MGLRKACGKRSVLEMRIRAPAQRFDVEPSIARVTWRKIRTMCEACGVDSYVSIQGSVATREVLSSALDFSHTKPAFGLPCGTDQFSRTFFGRDIPFGVRICMYI